jgi:hypothetical protein
MTFHKNHRNLSPSMPQSQPSFISSTEASVDDYNAENVDNTYYPSISDVCKTRAVLHQLGKSRNENHNWIGLPTELVDMIIDEAEYWPSVLTKMPKPVIVQDSTDKQCLLTPPLCYDLVCLVLLTQAQFSSAFFPPFPP